MMRSRSREAEGIVIASELRRSSPRRSAAATAREAVSRDVFTRSASAAITGGGEIFPDASALESHSA